MVKHRHLRYAFQVGGFFFTGTIPAAMECSKEQNVVDCNCTYDPCSRKGVCCQCIRYHKRMRQLPGCVFPNDVERTWDRSYETFARLVNEGRV
jgi:hypothetical protein